MAEDMKVPFLGSLPLDPRIGRHFCIFKIKSAAVFEMNWIYFHSYSILQVILKS